MKESNGESSRWAKSRLPLLPVVLGAVFLLASVASPVDAIGRHRSTTVSGNALPSECNKGEGVGALELTGDLEGCWIFLDFDFECEELNGFARYTEKGRESFSGTANGVEGTFKTKYTLEATYNSGACQEFDAGGFPFEEQITGGCDHYIVKGTGAFRRAKGLITFFDVIPDPGESGASNYFYAGKIRRLRS